MPKDGECPVSRIRDLADEVVWSLGDEVARISEREGPRAGGELSARQVRNCGLEATSDEPPERHSLIVGWPRAKHEQISLAQRLAADATLRLRT